jgi:DnaJ-class molecular chaperone
MPMTSEERKALKAEARMMVAALDAVYAALRQKNPCVLCGGTERWMDDRCPDCAPTAELALRTEH